MIVRINHSNDPNIPIKSCTELPFMHGAVFGSRTWIIVTFLQTIQQP